ncbi:nicastrin [Chelonus insularis]|uniref:nicastrin n=1 Tax=Chelonus insularis TaxID=460826 RepID=UPI001589EFD8|nr:nicastrin [Chelonus insularis]
MFLSLYFKLVVLIIAQNAVSAERIKDMIYMSIDGVAACFRRHNGTHQFGCSSLRGGSVGVIQLVETFDDVKWLETNATAGPYTIVIPFSMFTKDVMTRLDATNNINGVLITKNSTDALPSDYSPEDTCPNRYSSHQKCPQKPWNPYGNSFLLKDWKFPMFYMENNNEVLEEIKKCYYKYNANNLDEQHEYPLCAIEMQSFMSSALNSKTCIRRNKLVLYMNPTRFCDPLGDSNVHWPLAPLSNETESMILVTARLDASSQFDGIAPGADATVAGLVTFIAAAYHLYSLNATVNRTNVLFSLLNGESFDYIGSSRFVYDLKRGKFNALAGKTLKLEQISAIIELNQIGGDKLYLHAKNYEQNELIKSLQKSLSLENMTLPNSIPPTSAQTFLAAKPELPVAVLTSYGEQFVNPFYGGILDNAEHLGIYQKEINATLAKLAVKLGDVLYEQVTGKKSPSGNVTKIEELISEMLSCYLETAKCNLFQAASPPGASDILPDHSFSLYVGVSVHPNLVTSLTGQLLALLTGEKLPEMTAHECNEHRLAWMGGYNLSGICINSTVNYSLALSPAFTIKDYNWENGGYSTWTESLWTTLSVRMFLKPSAATERLTITLGSVVAVLSFIIVWFINSRAEILFDHTGATVDC